MNTFQLMQRAVLCLLTLLVLASPALATNPGSDKETEEEKKERLENSPSRISDEQIPVIPERFPQRPKPPVELGDKILGQGPINNGFQIPTGATWQPSLWAFGNWRTAVQTFDNSANVSSEIATRMDLFTNLRLTGTERIVLGLRPFDQGGQFTRYTFEPETSEDFYDETNAEVERLFFEGDFSELFPRLGRNGGQPRQLGFVIGRQPLFIQEGIMINDSVDAFGITRNNFPVRGTSNFRVSALVAWNQVHRNNNTEDPTAELYGLFTEWDRLSHTYNIDIAHVTADDITGSGTFIGIQRRANKGRFNTNLSVNASFATEEDTPEMSDGVLIFGELSFDRQGGVNLFYTNAFVAIDNYSSAARGPANGGPLGRLGLLYAAVGLGSYKAALSNRAGEAYGFATGYQHFFNVRRQLIVELGARADTGDKDLTTAALGLRFQQALGQHFLLQADAFTAYQEDLDEKFGSRVEIRYKF